MSLVPIGVVVAGPASSDYWSVAGASLAALLSGLYALSKRQPYLAVALHIIASVAVGTLAPGFLLWLVAVCHAGTYAHLEATASWQTWATVGLFCGLGGWALIHAIIRRWEKHSDGLASHPFRYFDTDSTYQDDDQ